MSHHTHYGIYYAMARKSKSARTTAFTYDTIHTSEAEVPVTIVKVRRIMITALPMTVDEMRPIRKSISLGNCDEKVDLELQMITLGTFKLKKQDFALIFYL
eukprot:scaffold816_cov80-Skeletonema_menzelii.AAC.1